MKLGLHLHSRTPFWLCLILALAAERPAQSRLADPLIVGILSGNLSQVIHSLNRRSKLLNPPAPSEPDPNAGPVTQPPPLAEPESGPPPSSLNRLFANLWDGRQKLKSSAHPGLPFLSKKHSDPSLTRLSNTAENSPDPLDFFDINATDDNGNSVLILAIKSRNKELVQAVLSNKPDLSFVNKHGDSALMWALEIHMTEIIDPLLEMGADPNQENVLGRTPVLLAASQCNYEGIQSLVAHGGKLTFPGKLGTTLLHFASAKASEHRFKIVDPEARRDYFLYLLERLEVDTQDAHGTTPLMYAVKGGDPWVVELLLAHGADLHRVDQDGNSPLHFAAAQIAAVQILKGNYSIVRELIHSGAHLELENKNGKTFLDVLSLRTPSVRKLFRDLKVLASLISGSSPMTGSASDILVRLLELKEPIAARLHLLASQRTETEPSPGPGPDGPLTGNSVEFEELTLLKYLVQHYSQEAYLLTEESQLPRLNEVKRHCILCHESRTLTEVQAEGPANCPCLICDECVPSYLEYLLHRDGAELSVCPECKGVVRTRYLKAHGVGRSDQFKFRGRQVAYGSARTPGWTPCPTENCTGGRPVSPGKEAFYSCPFCDWSGCLNCHADHRGSECARLGEEEKATQARLEKLIELGKLPSMREILDPEDERHYHGKFRACYHCGLMTERTLGCNGIICTQCGKAWHWNKGKSGDHDQMDLPQQYEPLFPAHF